MRRVYDWYMSGRIAARITVITPRTAPSLDRQFEGEWLAYSFITLYQQGVWPGGESEAHAAYEMGYYDEASRLLKEQSGRADSGLATDRRHNGPDPLAAGPTD